MEVLRMGKRNPDVDRQWRAFDRRLDREIKKDLNECEALLRELDVVCLDKLHWRLIRGNIDLCQYFRGIQVIVACVERLNGLAGEG